ncbi:MAG: hypothetical protein Q9160_005430 [Pyrenula sp. 1 TL-2023]
MPRTILSLRSHTSNWQVPQPRRGLSSYSRPPTTRAPSVTGAEPPLPSAKPAAGWAALIASAHDTYRRERQMTTSERVDEELAKRQQIAESVSGTTKVEPLTEMALLALNDPDQHKYIGVGENEENKENDVPDFSYAVAELAKNLEEARRAVRRKEKEVERLGRENGRLKMEVVRTGEMEAEIHKYKGWVAPETHEGLRKGWEDWADIAEKKVESLQERVDQMSERNGELRRAAEEKDATIHRLEERLAGATSSHERKVLDATIDMLRNDLVEMKEERSSCPLCAQKVSHADFRNTLEISKPGLGRQYTVA